MKDIPVRISMTRTDSIKTESHFGLLRRIQSTSRLITASPTFSYSSSAMTARFWWNRFGPMFAGEIRKRRIDRMRSFVQHASVHNHIN